MAWRVALSGLLFASGDVLLFRGFDPGGAFLMVFPSDGALLPSVFKGADIFAFGGIYCFCNIRKEKRYEFSRTKGLLLAALGVCRRDACRFAFSFSLRMDGRVFVCRCVFRRERVDVGAYETALFPDALICADRGDLLSRGALLLSDQISGDAARACSDPRAFLYV